MALTLVYMTGPRGQKNKKNSQYLFELRPVQIKSDKMHFTNDYAYSNDSKT